MNENSLKTTDSLFVVYAFIISIIVFIIVDKTDIFHACNQLFTWVVVAALKQVSNSALIFFFFCTFHYSLCGAAVAFIKSSVKSRQ